MTTPTNNKMMHDIRNCLNALRLNSAYLDHFAKEDLLDSMAGLIEAADRLDQLMVEFADDAPRHDGGDDSSKAPHATPPSYL